MVLDLLHLLVFLSGLLSPLRFVPLHSTVEPNASLAASVL